jgi:hypothetical protein
MVPQGKPGRNADVRAASLWNAEELKDRVPDEYKGDISNAVREASRLFSEAASSLKKVLDDLKCM